jgi:hypothetical protein
MDDIVADVMIATGDEYFAGVACDQIGVFIGVILCS